MSSFTALNIEPDDQSDDEVDNTKELQIEEALKLYQVALKLHSQGSAQYPQATEAYNNLLNSEIFKYPEAVTEFTRLYEHPELEYIDASLPLVLENAAGGTDGTPSTLPQILYLSYKNHGQFILDCLKYRRRNPDAFIADIGDNLEIQTNFALDSFSRALAWDESDTDLWRRAARIGALRGSRRISRFCLEAAVEVDDDPTVAEVEPSTLEEGFAGEQLKQQLEVLGDEVSLSHPIMAPFRKKTVAPFLTKYMDPYPFLPDPTKTLDPISPKTESNQSRPNINVPQRSWTALGEGLVQISNLQPGQSAAGVTISIPARDAENVFSQPASADHIMTDVGDTISPVADSNGSAIATPVTAKSDDRPIEVVTTSAVSLADDQTAERNVILPTRKRSQSTAGIRDTPEEDSGAQKRSKRIRNRDNTLDTPIVDPATQYAEQLKDRTQADEHTFELIDSFLIKLGVDDLGKYSELQAALAQESAPSRDKTLANTAARDLRDILRTWDEGKASTFVNSNAAEILGSSTGGANAGLAAFLEHSKSGPQRLSTSQQFKEEEGLSNFVRLINSQWMPLQDIVFEWVYSVLLTYRRSQWPDELKRVVVQIISFNDADIFERIQTDFERLSASGGESEHLLSLLEISETLFELHLDVYSRITNPSSIVSYDIRITTKDRLDRWATFSASAIRFHRSEPNDELMLRYLWASVFYATMTEGVSRDHKIILWSDLQALLSGQIIELQNNAVMPEISAVAAEREVSRLTTMDFFYNLFQTDKSDPIAIINTLEPVLDPDSACQQIGSEVEDAATPQDNLETTPPALRDMWKFLKSGSTSLRLFLWQRLREAYFSIGYTTKVFSCHLKTIEIIVADLRTDDYVDSSDEPRRHKLLVWLKALDDLLVKALTIALNDSNKCFEIIDERHIKSTCAALAQLNRILHTAAIFDDEVSVGMTVLPPKNPAYAQPHGSFNGFINKLREMQVRTWALQYTMVKEAMTQFQDVFRTQDTDLADYLAAVHYQLGLRKCCKASNKIFLKMMKVEMIRLKHVDKWEDYQGQVLFDLYGIRLGVGTYMLSDHGCPTETLDRRTVMSIADQVIILANQMSMKDLLKHELKLTIDKMQAAIGKQKDNSQMQHNLRNYTEYLKGSIRPIVMYQALKGLVQVDSLPVQSAESPLAEKGWYFLMGMLSLTKFRTQKRLGPGAQTDDLKVGASFLRLQLQFTSEHWETWYRLAQCFDFELEEEVLWSADKINNHGPELIRLQRSAIHCYVMALSMAMRNADSTFLTAEKLSEMYYDFGMRLYASSREPFGMEPFWVDGFERHMSGTSGMYKKALHMEMSRYKVWKYASELFRRSLMDRPNYWMNHFMLGKCQWKMYTKGGDEWDARDGSRPTLDTIIKCFVKAIETVPKPKDSRQEPALEPHYKLVSTVHKLVLRQDLELQDATDLLQQQPYAIRKGEHVEIADVEQWDQFVLECFRHLRNADKQHWHHRMIARVAKILYDDSKPDYAHADAARLEFRESIFTKTMHIQVWKPDAERPGRHAVYMQRYVLFMTKLLFIINDKTNMELLAKRVKKKSADFFHFNEVWAECCTTYLRLIRRAAEIPANVDEVFKSTSHEEFELFSDRINTWAAAPQISHPALDALRETVELKKVNANTMKSTPIDDMINDIWAVLFTQVAKTLPGPDLPTLQQAQLDGEAAAAARASGPMSLNNLVMNMDGTASPSSALLQSEPPRPRKIGISRREVLRRAELAINRAPEGAAQPRTLAPSSSRPSLSLSTLAPPMRVLGSNVSTNSAGSGLGSNTGTGASAEANLDADVNLGAGEGDEASKQRREESEPPGSLHDSADDESDLSDVPDMDDVDESGMGLGMMFPNLRRGNNEENGTRGSSGVGTPPA